MSVRTRRMFAIPLAINLRPVAMILRQCGILSCNQRAHELPMFAIPTADVCRSLHVGGPNGSRHFLGITSVCTWDRRVGDHYGLACVPSCPVARYPAKTQRRPTQAGPIEVVCTVRASSDAMSFRYRRDRLNAGSPFRPTLPFLSMRSVASWLRPSDRGRGRTQLPAIGNWSFKPPRIARALSGTAG